MHWSKKFVLLLKFVSKPWRMLPASVPTLAASATSRGYGLRPIFFDRKEILGIGRSIMVLNDLIV